MDDEERTRLLQDLLSDLDAPTAGRRPPKGFAPRGDEEVRLVLQGVQLLELRTSRPPLVGGRDLLDLQVDEGLAMAAPGAPRVRSLPIEGSVPALDTGTAVVTDQRLVFIGEGHRREWAYAELEAGAHDRTAPETWLSVFGRRRTSGLRYGADDALELRAELALAAAAVRGERDRLRACLRAQLPAPAPTSPPAAPVPGTASAAARAGRVLSLVYLGKPGVAPGLRVAQGVLAGLLTLALVQGVVGSHGETQLAVQSAAPGPVAAAPADTQAQQSQQAAQQAAARQAAEQEAARKVAEQATAQAAAAKAKADADAAQAAARAAAERQAADQAAATKAQAQATAQAEARAAAEATAAAAAAPAATGKRSSGCEPSYPDFCIPAGRDVDCGELDQKRFTAREPDPYDLDRDSDGIACES